MKYTQFFIRDFYTWQRFVDWSTLIILNRCHVSKQSRDTSPVARSIDMHDLFISPMSSPNWETVHFVWFRRKSNFLKAYNSWNSNLPAGIGGHRPFHPSYWLLSQFPAWLRSLSLKNFNPLFERSLKYLFFKRCHQIGLCWLLTKITH